MNSFSNLRRQLLMLGAGIFMSPSMAEQPYRNGLKHIVAKIFNIDAPVFQTNDSARAAFKEMQTLGVTDVMMLESLYTKASVQACLPLVGLKVWVICQVFYNDKFVGKNLERQWAITENGTPAFENSPDGAWLRMLCPHGGTIKNPSSGFIRKHTDEIKNIVKHRPPDGISLDFTRYFSYWEGITHKNQGRALVDTCFCRTCLDLFEQQQNIQLPKFKSIQKTATWIHNKHQTEWTEFKTHSITNFVRKFIDETKTVSPHIQFNLHAVPWLTGEYDNARERIVGQSLADLIPHLDWISPMCYTQLMHKPSSWIKEVVDDFKLAGQSSHRFKIIPAIEVKTSATKFEDNLNALIASRADGVAFWPWESLSTTQKRMIYKLSNMSNLK